jgi:signal transduction histidine kinase
MWQGAVAPLLLSLPPIWLAARFASRWMGERISEPMHALLLQCHAIRCGQSSKVGLSEERCGELAPLIPAIDDLLRYCEHLVVRQHCCMVDTAHELRTPLTAQAVVGENVLAARAGTLELREAVSSMLEEAKHMKRLIDSMLALTNVSMHRSVVTDADRKVTPVDICELARDCAHALQVLAEEKNQSMSLILPRALWVNADITLVRQALLNVIHNAIEHCPDGTEIELETAESDDYGLIRVRDHGPGIPIEHQARVFDRFYRGASTPGHRGLGLGLSIARAILISQGGSIRLHSAPGLGCCFTLALRLIPKTQMASPASAVHGYRADVVSTRTPIAGN